jgi:hypothetical protein
MSKEDELVALVRKHGTLKVFDMFITACKVRANDKDYRAYQENKDYTHLDGYVQALEEYKPQIKTRADALHELHRLQKEVKEGTVTEYT